ncbi:rho family-interacting cell polarization regulator 1-like [Cyrtonyx montezumae]|uniref:rho family-interacting cell polarization regulator 1-like n=1 Tax=Cyrtonyx montezumae TaxID=9017 RepID=UPI0032DB225E
MARNLSPFTPTISCKTGSRVSRTFSMFHKSRPPKEPQPDHLDEVYKALKKGLMAYLELQQCELEKLSTQHCESERNVRLVSGAGKCLWAWDSAHRVAEDKADAGGGSQPAAWDTSCPATGIWGGAISWPSAPLREPLTPSLLFQQVKSIERFLRRLEFHASKIDELYEAYCIQRRLRDGAHNMVKAYSTGLLGSRAARESLAKASKSYREYTENMCLLESEMESQLGEFHVRMKGLAGFAWLCAGDRYKIFMKYGRQQWKLRGHIEMNSKQVWDSEEMVFLPHITELLSIKVTELKSLVNHEVVGNVSRETKNLFAALPQVVSVDISYLGTLKLILEVTWNPFRKDDQPSAVSTINKDSMAKESIEQLVYLCQTDKEPVQEAAKQSLMLCGEVLQPSDHLHSPPLDLLCQLLSPCVGSTLSEISSK